MTAGGSASDRAAALRAGARRGVWRRVLAWLGVTAHTRRADAVAARWDRGAAGEKATKTMLDVLEAAGWHILHDQMQPPYRANLDHVLTSPCGTAIVVLDTKAWRRNWPTTVRAGRLHCGNEDRHDEAEKVVKYACRLATALGMAAGQVQPLMVVHGSPVAGGAVQVPVPGGAVWVLGPDRLVPNLAAAPKQRDLRRAADLAARVDRVLTPYVQRR